MTYSGERVLTKEQIGCSVKYSLLICFLTGARFCIWEMLILNYLDSDLFGMIVQIVWFVLAEFFIIRITSGFVYILLHGKRRFKRFFSFLHFKYFKANLLTLITYSIFFGVSTFAVNYLRFVHTRNFDRIVFYFCAVILLFINLFKLIFAYFRAKDPNADFKSISRSFFGFLRNNFGKTVLFLLRLFPWLIGYVFLIILFRKTDFEIVFYVMLNSCMFGLGIFFFPYYFLSFDKFVRSSEQ